MVFRPEIFDSTAPEGGGIHLHGNFFCPLAPPQIPASFSAYWKVFVWNVSVVCECCVFS